MVLNIIANTTITVHSSVSKYGNRWTFSHNDRLGR